MGMFRCFEGYSYIALFYCLSYSVTTGALGIPHLLPACSIITISLHITIMLTMTCLSVFLHLYIYNDTILTGTHHSSQRRLAERQILTSGAAWCCEMRTPQTLLRYICPFPSLAAALSARWLALLVHTFASPRRPPRT